MRSYSPHREARALRLLVLSVVLSGCVVDESVSSHQMAVNAICSFQINTGGTTKTVEMESDYLQRVLACEARSDANLQALMAQAVAARTYTIYRFTSPYPADRVTVAGDGQSFQVYGCGTYDGASASRRALIDNAVSSTRGQVLTFDNHIIASFFVSGAITQGANGCYYESGDPDPLGSEHHVTYNEGKTGSEKDKSSQGGDNPYNQGSMSQNGAFCLEGIGYDYRRILGFYYGADVPVQSVSGTCTGTTPPPPTCTPTGPEICGDGKDNDCNPQTSDTCSTPTPPPTCTPTGPEICDGRDNDCNNQIDDGDPGGGAYCTVNGQNGPCATGVTHCRNGTPVCEPTYTPKAETCNKVDDNCNGQIDDVPGGCGTTCTPQPEICNGLDDDCNNIPDDGNPQGGQVCYPGGACPVGVTICQAGAIVCQPQAQQEVCDGKDNDCNGYIDDVPGGCSGTSGCVPSGPEVCDKKDNDCNGYTDDVNGGCTPGCVPSGIEVCDNIDNDCNGFTDDVLGGCNNGCVPSGLEVCDGRDNDCNGRIDDTATGCVPGCIASGAEVCDGRDNDCNGLNDDVPGGCGTGPALSNCVPQPERCNGVDDDCDGFPDEGNPEGGDGCTIYTASLPFAGVMMCISGQLVCQVEDPGTASFTGALQPIRGAGCSAAAGDTARALPSLILLLLLFSWRRDRPPRR